MLNLRPLLSQLSLQTKSLTTVRLDLTSKSEFAWAQGAVVDAIEKQYNQGKPVRIIVLKARQVGISTVTEGVLFNWGFIHPGMSGVVIANETDTATSIFQKTEFYWEHWPFKQFYNRKYASKRHMQWLETGSSLRIATAKTVTSGRGSTLHALHATECAFYPYPEILFTGLNQAIPNKHGTLVVLESTAFGTGNWWHNSWKAAEEGESDYIPLFFPWHHHPEYQLPTTLCTTLELTPYERNLIKLHGATYENIAWRRWAIPNLCEADDQKFLVEYPTTPEEAFVGTGRPIFPRERLKDCYDFQPGIRGIMVDKPDGSVEFIHDPSGYLTIFKKPPKGDRRSDRYFVAGDPSRSIVGDPSCIQVINRATFEQVAVYHGRVDPVSFGDEMIRVGKFYNFAMLCPESEGGGQATIGTIVSRNYPSIWVDKKPDRAPGKIGNWYGYAMNFQRKSYVIGVLKRMIIDGSLILHDKKTYNQLDSFIELPNGDFGTPGQEGHADAVMALAICVACSRTEGPFVDDSPRSPLSHPRAGLLPNGAEVSFADSYGDDDGDMSDMYGAVS